MNVFVTIGIPGSGKSTYLKNVPNENKCIISRDAIRFAMLQEGENYFTHEDTVIAEFHKQIKQALETQKENIYVDATHLTPKARKYIIDFAKKYNCEIIALYFDVSLEVALKRNEQRTGLAYVPSAVIRRMWHSIQRPTTAEGFTKIINIF